MPKRRRDFSRQLVFSVSEEMRYQLIAWGYLRGNGGMYAAIARDFLRDKLLEALETLNERQRADYDEILRNVKIEEELKGIKNPPSIRPY